MGLIGGGLRPWLEITPAFDAVIMSRNRQARSAQTRGRGAWLPPRWFVVLFWHVHRGLLRVTGGRVGLWRPRPGGWGALRLTTVGRHTGRPRQVHARRAQGGERERLWSRWAEIDKNLDAYAARRPAETAVVVFEPQDAVGPAPRAAGRATDSQGGAP